MGQPTYGNAYVSYTESIGIEKETRGTETSKYPEEEKETSIPSVAASERGRAQTETVAMQPRGCRTALSHTDCERNGLERPAIAGESPLREARSGVAVS